MRVRRRWQSTVVRVAASPWSVPRADFKALFDFFADFDNRLSPANESFLQAKFSELLFCFPHAFVPEAGKPSPD
jgi:hypothetical protein